MKKSIPSPLNCPCNSEETYENCCQKHIEKTHITPTAETLMRSRYTAFTLNNEEYLRYSWHPDTCPQIIRLDSSTQWLGLSIKNIVAGRVNDDEGFVEFVARNKINGKANRLHENSRFTRIDSRWVYVNGEQIAK